MTSAMLVRKEETGVGFCSQELCAGVMPILETCEAGGLLLHLWPDAYHTPYAKLMAMLVLVAKVQTEQNKLAAPGGPTKSSVLNCSFPAL